MNVTCYQYQTKKTTQDRLCWNLFTISHNYDRKTKSCISKNKTVSKHLHNVFVFPSNHNHYSLASYSNIHPAMIYLTKISNRVWSKDKSIHISRHFQIFLRWNCHWLIPLTELCIYIRHSTQLILKSYEQFRHPSDAQNDQDPDVLMAQPVKIKNNGNNFQKHTPSTFNLSNGNSHQLSACPIISTACNKPIQQAVSWWVTVWYLYTKI